MQPSLLPLVLDLDGTLIHTDTLHNMLVSLAFKRPWMLSCLPLWFLKGRPYAKARLVEHISLAPETLPYNTSLLEFARKEAQRGRKLILATGTNQALAEKIAHYLNIFDEVIGSDTITNMTGHNKRKALVQRFGEQGFDYAGDSMVDLHVWKASQMALVVNPKRGVFKAVQEIKAPHLIQMM